MNTTQTAQKLIELRTKKGVTQEAVADVLGISNKTISRWETGTALPESEYLPALADYFEVSIDELFGRENSKLSVADIIKKEVSEVSLSDSLMKAFELTANIINGCFTAKLMQTPEEDELISSAETPVPPYILEDNLSRIKIACELGYELLVNTKENNMAVMLFGNESNFSWLTEKRSELVSLFAFLADENVLKIIQLFHTREFPGFFTADFLAGKIGVSLEQATEMIEKLNHFNLCSKYVKAHLKGGETSYVYAGGGGGGGNGMILALLSLAYEILYGKRGSQRLYGSPVKMIRETSEEVTS